jgi:hypothetical protein
LRTVRCHHLHLGPIHQHPRHSTEELTDHEWYDTIEGLLVLAALRPEKRERFTGARLAVGKEAGALPIERRLHERLAARLEHVVLPAHRAQHGVEGEVRRDALLLILYSDAGAKARVGYYTAVAGSLAPR